jgi:hypothetical protein
VVVVLGIVAIIISALQALLMLFRQGALVVLAGTLPLAAAGTLAPATRPWFKKVTGWMLALIVYKPAAAAVYAAAFMMTGTGKNLTTVLTGFAMVGMSLLALPVLMKFFTWTTGQVSDSSGAGGFMQAALGGAVAVGALRGASGGLGGSGAADQAREQSQRLGPADGGPSGARTPAGAATASSGAGAGATSHTASAGTAAAGTAAGAGAAGSSAAAGAAAAGGPWGAAAGVAVGAYGAGRNATASAMQPADQAGGQ